MASLKEILFGAKGLIPMGNETGLGKWLGTESSGVPGSAHMFGQKAKPASGSLTAGAPGAGPRPKPAPAGFTGPRTIGEVTQRPGIEGIMDRLGMGGGNPLLAAAAPTAQVPVTGFNASASSAYDTAIGGIQGKYQRALTEIARREAAAKAALASMPGRLSKTYETGQANMQAFAQPLVTAANAQIPVGPGTGPGIDASGLSPILAASQASLAERQADMPLLETGVGNFLGGQRTMLDMAQADELAQMRLAQAEAQQSAGLANAQMMADATGRNAGFQHDRDMALLNFDLDQQAKGNTNQFMPGGVSVDRAMTFTPTYLTHLRAQPKYGQMQKDFLADVTANAGDTEIAVSNLLAKYGSNYPDTLSVFLASHSG